MPLTNGSRVAHHEILAPPGRGGITEVYRARDSQLGREAQTLAALNHPNIAAIHGPEESDGLPHLVVELIEG